MRTFVILSLLFLSLAAKAQAATYYVSTTGNDNNPGTITESWVTIRKASQTLVAGDTVLVRGGTYNIPNDQPAQTKYTGTPDAYITYKNYPDETPILKGNYPKTGDPVYAGIDVTGKSYITIEGFTIEGFRVGLSCKAPGHHVIFKNNNLQFNSSSGISSTNKVSGTEESCDYMTIEGNKIHDNGYYLNGNPATGVDEGWGSGISINPHTHPYSFDEASGFHNIIRGNMIYHNYDGTGGNGDPAPPAAPATDHTDGNGIIFDMTGDMKPALVENNIIFNNGGRGINTLGAKNIWIIGNTLYHNHFDPYSKSLTGKGEIIGRDYIDSSSNITYPVNNIHIINNIIIPKDSNFATYFNTTKTNLDNINNNARNNIWFGGSFNSQSVLGSNYSFNNPQLNNLSLDPLQANFHPNLNSWAIDNGSSSFDSQQEVQLKDFDGTTRPQNQYDIGAYEVTKPLESKNNQSTQPTRLYFSPSKINLPTNEEFTVDLMVDVRSETVTKVNSYLNFNHNLIQVVGITPDRSTLPTVLASSFNNSAPTGTITYSAQSNQGVTGGKKKLATFTFRTLNSPSEGTWLTFVDKSPRDTKLFFNNKSVEKYLNHGTIIIKGVSRSKFQSLPVFAK